jgi:hypothetical protein
MKKSIPGYEPSVGTQIAVEVFECTSLGTVKPSKSTALVSEGSVIVHTFDRSGLPFESMWYKFRGCDG